MKSIQTFFAASIFFTALSHTSLCYAQDSTMRLTLQDAISLSIKNSKQLRASEARIEEAEAEYVQAKNYKLPSATVSGAYLRVANPTINLKTNIFSHTDSTGGNSGSANTAKVNQAVYGILNIAYPIYAGGKVRYGIESARYLQQAAVLDAANDKEAVVLNTINAYTNLYKAIVTVNVVRENLQQSLYRDSVLSRLEQNGLLARNDLLKAQLQSSNIELSVLDAENNQKIANINMNLMLGLPEHTTLMPDSLSFEKNINIKNLEDYEQMALQNRKDAMSLAFRKKAATAGIGYAKADMYPSVAITGGYVAADIPHFITITNAVNVGIGVKYDIGSLWKTKANVTLAQAREKEIIASQEQLTDAIKLSINQAYENYLLSNKKIAVYRQAVDQATENYRITKNKYDNNLVNTTDLLDANVSLLQAKINLAVAKADVQLAYNTLLENSGVLSTQ